MKKTMVTGIFAALLLLAVTAVGQDYTFQQLEEVSTSEMLYTRGLVSEVIVETQIVRVRPPKEKRVDISVNLDTVLEGLNEIGQLQKKDQVKVWYVVEGEVNTAIKIVKMLDLGC